MIDGFGVVETMESRLGMSVSGVRLVERGHGFCCIFVKQLHLVYHFPRVIRHTQPNFIFRCHFVFDFEAS
jgi:hypothetical protein